MAGRGGQIEGAGIGAAVTGVNDTGLIFNIVGRIAADGREAQAAVGLDRANHCAQRVHMSGNDQRVTFPADFTDDIALVRLVGSKAVSAQHVQQVFCCDVRKARRAGNIDQLHQMIDGNGSIGMHIHSLNPPKKKNPILLIRIL